MAFLKPIHLIFLINLIDGTTINGRSPICAKGSSKTEGHADFTPFSFIINSLQIEEVLSLLRTSTLRSFIRKSKIQLYNQRFGDHKLIYTPQSQIN
ncbi:hypothetical protein BpHYR1_029437 [Brachionus plicatilis]|uniref:Uncharacterized protein n=1 Tax=Brachionus plicatilis TaxID=10195 RepID=A0A3M7QM03_BRAPC|nr:hypothetical protein BpHYR1_029437 [Brachionus plicatilis]